MPTINGATLDHLWVDVAEDDDRDDDWTEDPDERDDGLDEHDLGRCGGPGMCDACDRYAFACAVWCAHDPAEPEWHYPCPRCGRRRRRTCARGTARQRRATVRARIQRDRRAARRLARLDAEPLDLPW